MSHLEIQMPRTGALHPAPDSKCPKRDPSGPPGISGTPEASPAVHFDFPAPQTPAVRPARKSYRLKRERCNALKSAGATDYQRVTSKTERV
jgi:hypothetical protein